MGERAILREMPDVDDIFGNIYARAMCWWEARVPEPIQRVSMACLAGAVAVPVWTKGTHGYRLPRTVVNAPQRAVEAALALVTATARRSASAARRKLTQAAFHCRQWLGDDWDHAAPVALLFARQAAGHLDAPSLGIHMMRDLGSCGFIGRKTLRTVLRRVIRAAVKPSFVATLGGLVKTVRLNALSAVALILRDSDRCQIACDLAAEFGGAHARNFLGIGPENSPGLSGLSGSM